MSAVELARASAQHAELNAQNSSSRLGADIASLRDELRKVSNYRRAVAKELSELPAGCVASTAPDLPSPRKECSELPTGCVASTAPVLPSPISHHRSERPAEAASRSLPELHTSQTDTAGGSSSSRAVPAAADAPAATGNGLSSPQHRKARRGRGVLLDDSDDEEVIRQRRQDKARDHEETERRQKLMDEMQKELAVLQEESAAKAQRAAAARAELHNSEESCADIKGTLLMRFANFDGVVAALRGHPFVERSTPPALHGAVERSHGKCWRTSVQQKKDQWPPNQPWDFKEFTKELRARLHDTSATFVELDEMRQRSQTCEELEASMKADTKSLQRFLSQGEAQIQELREQLQDEDNACNAASARLTSEQSRLLGLRDGSEAAVERFESKARLIAEECRELAGAVADENSQLKRAAYLLPRRDQLISELEQRDAAACSLNEQLVNIWREEEVERENFESHQNHEAELRAEVSRERDAVASLEAEEDMFRSEAARITDKVKALAEDDAEAAPGVPSIRDLSALDASSMSLASFATEVPSVAREIEQLQAELHVHTKGELHATHASVISELHAVRNALRDENAQWRMEMAEAQEAAYVQNALSPDMRAMRNKSVAPPESGYRRALCAWDEIFDDGPRQSAATNGQPVTNGNGHPVTRDLETLANDSPWPGRRGSGVPSILSAGTAGHVGVPLLQHAPSTPLRRQLNDFDSARQHESGPQPWHHQNHQAAVAQALDTLDALMQGSASLQQAETEWHRLEEATDAQIASLSAARRPPMTNGIDGNYHHVAHRGT